MFKPGSIIVVTDDSMFSSDVCYVTVKKNHGYAVGVGWILFTEEGNYLFVNVEEAEAGLHYCTRVLFVTDPFTLKTLP